MYDPSHNYDLGQNYFVNDSSCEVEIEKSLESEESVASSSLNLTQFVDCGETIKEEIKEEVNEEYQRDPLRLSNAVQSLDEPVTYEEFICEG